MIGLKRGIRTLNGWATAIRPNTPVSRQVSPEILEAVRKALNMATVLARTLREKVVIEENGKRKTVSKLEAAIAQLVSKAMFGDGHAIRYLCQLVASAEERSIVVEPTTQLSETDRKVMANILKRFRQSFKEKNDETNLD